MNKARTLISQLNVNEMANLRPTDTGLPVFIWVDEMGEFRTVEHNLPRIKVAEDSPTNLVAVISIDNNPKLLDGKLEYKKLKKVIEWVILNHDILMKHWNGNISTKEMFSKLISM